MTKDAARGASTSPGKVTERFWSTADVDPITFRVIGGALKAIAGEMAQMLYRMAYSSVIRESEDLGAGIFDVEGREFCESDSTPMHIGSLPAYINGCNDRWLGRYSPGDVIMHNNPFSGSSHSPDYAVLIPIFLAGRHIAFAGCTGHLLDVGGAAPAISIDAIDVYAEGGVLDAVLIETNGVRNVELWRHIMGNVRTGEMNAGDVEAMIACCRLGEQRFLELIDRYGVDTVMSTVERWQDLVETRLRREIEAVPDGVYRAPDGFYDDDGVHRGRPLPLSTAVIVSGSDILIDLTGSSTETMTACNCPFEGSVLPTANFAVRTLFLDEARTPDFLPQNDGVFRPVSVRAPRGTIFNPNFPRATSARFPLINRIPDQVNLALANVLPHLVTAGNSASVQGVAYSGSAPDGSDSYWVHLEIGEGAYGARFGGDGIDAVDNLMANTRNTPIEETEMRAPLRCERYELRDHPPAPGQWRGGVGSVRTWRFLVDTTVGANGDSRSDRPRGLFGGHDGVPGKITHHGPDGPVVLGNRFAAASFAAGTSIEVEVPSAAGYGSPLDRSPVAVHGDVLDGLYDRELAGDVFGVVLGSDGALDAAATDAKRRSMREASVDADS